MMKKCLSAVVLTSMHANHFTVITYDVRNSCAPRFNWCLSRDYVQGLCSLVAGMAQAPLLTRDDYLTAEPWTCTHWIVSIWPEIDSVHAILDPV